MSEAERNRKALGQRAELYYASHPGGAAAVRRPRLTQRNGIVFATLRNGTEDKIVGAGESVEAALSAFDLEYLHYIRPVAA